MNSVSQYFLDFTSLWTTHGPCVFNFQCTSAYHWHVSQALTSWQQYKICSFDFFGLTNQVQLR